MATAIRQHDTFLEQAIENLGDIPPDLMRYLSLIKVLDSKCETLSDRIQESVDALLAMPPVQSNPSAAFQRLQAKIEEDRKMLMQFSSEKVHIAQQVFDLVESNAIDLEDKIEDAENDLARTQFAELGDFPPPASAFASPAGIFGGARTTTPRPLEEWGSLAPTPTLGADQTMPPLSAAPSLIGGLPAPPAAALPPSSSMKRPTSAGAPPVRVMLKKPGTVTETPMDQS